MESKEDEQLLDEIHYLTNLIHSRRGRGQCSYRSTGTTKGIGYRTTSSSSNHGNILNSKFSRKKKVNKSSKYSKRQLPIKSQLTWKRKILDDHVKKSSHAVEFNSTKLGTSLGSAKQRNSAAIFTKLPPVATVSRLHTASGVNVYKRRELPLDSRSMMSPLAYQNKFKITRASCWRKYDYIRHYPQKIGRQQRRLSRYLCYPTVINEKKRTDRLKGHSSRSKNRVWIATGCKTKTRPGNLQWMANRHLQLTQQSLRKAALLSSAKKASLVSLQKGKYVLDSSGKRLKKVDSTALISTPPRTVKYCINMEASVKRVRANHVVEKSKRYAWYARNKNKDKSKQYCIFFNKFGKCNKGETCPYVHDPDKIAVCIKYLKGLCEKTDGSCPFSHVVCKEKMPVCSFFLRGICSRENCPYLHVSVGRDADICLDFVKGYCSRGEHCTKKHIVDCPEFMDSGECSKGKHCPLRHRSQAIKSGFKDKNAGRFVKQPRAFGNLQRKASKQPTSEEMTGHEQSATYSSHELNFIPLEINEAPDFIAL